MITSSTVPSAAWPRAEIEHAVERAEQRIELVGAEQHGDAEFGCSAARSSTTRALVVRVEADQRLVEQQQPRPADQRLGQQQALPLAARDLGQRPPRQVGGADQLERPSHLARGRRGPSNGRPSDGR